MAEPFASGVLGSLLVPRVPAIANRSMARVARSSSGQPSFAANFFTPTPRQWKGKAKSEVHESFELGHILDYRAWACPPSKDWLWGQDGTMRTTLSREIAPARPMRVGPRIRRNSKSSRGRFKSLLSQKGGGMRHPHGSYSTSSHVARNPGPSMVERRGLFSTSAHDQPVASTSTAEPPSIFQEYRELLKTQAMSDYLPEYAEAFSLLQDEFALATVPDLLDFGELLAHQIDMLCVNVRTPEVIREWGTRLHDIHLHLQQRIHHTGLDADRANSLLSRAHAFMGRLREAETHIRRTPPESLNPSLISYILSIGVHENLSSALQYVLSRGKYGLLPFQDPTFVRFLTKVDGIQEVFALTANRISPSRYKVANVLISTLNEIQAYTAASEAIKEALKGSIKLRGVYMTAACLGLSSQGHRSEAHDLYMAMCVGTKKGVDWKNFQLLREHFYPEGKPPEISPSQTRFKPSPGSAEAVAFFEYCHPRGPDGRRSIKAERSEYHDLLNMFCRPHERPEIDNMREVFEDMHDNGIEPILQTFSIMSRAYRALGDAKGVWDTLRAMKEKGIQGDLSLYTNLISWLGRRVDAKAASALYARAIKEGVKVDAIMNNALMHCYARAGSWKDAIALFEHIKSSTKNAPAVSTYNIILQASLLCGASLRTISKLFFTLESQGVQPNKYSYAILIQSASAARRYDYVHQVYLELKRKDEEENAKLLNVVTLTLLLKAFLQGGYKIAAKKMFAEMRQRDIKPNAVTFRAILQSYGQDGTEAGLALAEEFVEKLENSSEDMTHAPWTRVEKPRQQPLANIYTPLIASHVQNQDMDAAEETYARFLAAGGQPSLSPMSALLAGYRNAMATDKIIKLWPVIREVALKQSTVGDLGDGETISTKMGLITDLLSTYTQALSEAGHHAAVMDAWNDLQSLGQPFSESNWHDYLLACIRAGLIERAFNIAEKILIPLNLKSRTNYRRSLDKTKRNMEAKYRELQEDFHELPPVNPMHHEKTLLEAGDTSRRDALGKYNTRLQDELAMAEDFAYDLKVLQVINPAWKRFLLHERALTALLIVLHQLQQGYAPRASYVGEKLDHDVPPVDLTVTHSENSEVLASTIWEQCPLTIGQLERYRVKMQRLHGEKAFRRIFDRPEMIIDSSTDSN